MYVKNEDHTDYKCSHCKVSIINVLQHLKVNSEISSSVLTQFASVVSFSS